MGDRLDGGQTRCNSKQISFTSGDITWPAQLVTHQSGKRLREDVTDAVERRQKGRSFRTSSTYSFVRLLSLSRLSPAADRGKISLCPFGRSNGVQTTVKVNDVRDWLLLIRRRSRRVAFLSSLYPSFERHATSHQLRTSSVAALGTLLALPLTLTRFSSSPRPPPDPINPSRTILLLPASRSFLINSSRIDRGTVPIP